MEQPLADFNTNFERLTYNIIEFEFQITQIFTLKRSQKKMDTLFWSGSCLVTDNNIIDFNVSLNIKLNIEGIEDIRHRDITLEKLMPIDYIMIKFDQ